MSKPYIIGIAGESGVGKSTIAEMLCAYYGIENVVVLSTDDLHKWCRNDKNWENFTHLNNEANNLELGDQHLEDLKNGKPIYRSVYSHKHGHFEAPIKIFPKDIIIVEGLHAFYTEKSKQNIDKKIYVETEENLRVHWKIIRDTSQRSGTKEKVLEAIRKRKADALDIRVVQLPESDIVVNLSTKSPILEIGNKDEIVDICCSITKKDDEECKLYDFIKSYTEDMNSFIDVSEMFGRDIEYVQNGGGNISVKISDEVMLIKSSGVEMKDIRSQNGYSITKYNNVDNIISVNNKRPSMEVKMHTFLKKYVIHLHPIYVLSILCMKNSKEIIKSLFENVIQYKHINFCIPGEPLAQQISENCNEDIFFLDNHGIIVSDNDLQKCIENVKKINFICKKFVIEKAEKQFILKENLEQKQYLLFPDAIIYGSDKKETFAVNNFVNKLDKTFGSIRILDEEVVNQIQNLESEKYRKNL